MDRRRYSPHDPYNSYNSYYGSYDSSHDYSNSSSYRSDDYQVQYGEAPSLRPQPLAMSTTPCAFCNSRMHMVSDCYHLHGVAPPTHQQWSGHHQTGNSSYNTNNHQWNGQQNLIREEGNSYGVLDYQWEPSSQFGMPSPLNTTIPVSHSPPSSSDALKLIFKKLEDLSSHLDKNQEEIGEKFNALGELADLFPSKILPKLERMEEEHDCLHDQVMLLAHSMSEQQAEVHEPSALDNLESYEEDSEDEDDVIIIDDVVFPITSPSPLPYDGSDQQCEEATPSVHDEAGMYDCDSPPCNELDSSTPSPVSFCTCGSDDPCAACLEIDEWLAMNQDPLLNSSEPYEVLKESMVLEPVKEDREELSKPPLPTCPEQLDTKIEIPLTPLFVEFVVPVHIFHSQYCLYDYISFCDEGMIETRTEEQVKQREGNTACSLQRRRLLPLWIFKENLKPD